jgi:hypothetical protein
MRMRSSPRGVRVRFIHRNEDGDQLVCAGRDLMGRSPVGPALPARPKGEAVSGGSRRPPSPSGFQRQVGLPRGEPLAANFTTALSPKGVEIPAYPARDLLDFHLAAQNWGMPGGGAQDGSGGPRQDMSPEQARRLSRKHRRWTGRPAHGGQRGMSRHWTPRTLNVRERHTENIMRLAMWHGSTGTGA